MYHQQQGQVIVSNQSTQSVKTILTNRLKSRDYIIYFAVKSSWKKLSL